jgi:hypothetical protein
VEIKQPKQEADGGRTHGDDQGHRERNGRARFAFRHEHIHIRLPFR